MSDFVSHDMLTDLWDEILKRLWNYLETEESVQKLEERKKLETCLKEFLCIVPHDRKFFLPETAEVLKRTVRELDNFTANKAINGFESIFQYASNLFTKPWRKEYRVLKLYSGFYQHEVQSNLMDAIKLFEAMGYRQLSDDILVLDGPICPDQMANVSRDALAAYVECQIMKQIYLGLETLNLDCTWQDVFHYREKHTGSTSQAIKNLAYVIQERRMRKDKNCTLDNFYSSVATTLQSTSAKNAHYQNCTSYAQPQATTIYAPHNGGVCAMHASQTVLQTQPQPHACSMHHAAYATTTTNNNINGKYATGYVQHHQRQHYASEGQPHMSHSRSLEQYNEPPPLLPHRHSFDHQHQGCMSNHLYQQPVYATTVATGQPAHVYESPYDCVDSTNGSNASYAMVSASPYNVSGNRYPLPYSISTQLNAHYASPTTVTCNGIKGNDNYMTNNADNLYASVSKNATCNMYHHAPLQPPAIPHILPRCAADNVKDFHNYRQRSFPPDQHLIDLHGVPQNNSFDSAYEQQQQHANNARQSRRAVNRLAASYAQPRDLVCNTRAITPNSYTSSQTAVSGNEMYDSYGYARPIPRASRNKLTTEQQQQQQQQQQYVRNNNMQVFI